MPIATSQQPITRGIYNAQNILLPPPVLEPQPPPPRITLLNQIGFEEPFEFLEYEVDLDSVSHIFDDSTDPYLDYYVVDTRGKVKPVHQLAIVRRGWDLNPTSRRIPIQCYHY